MYMDDILATCVLDKLPRLHLNCWVLVQGYSRAGEVPQLSANVLQVSNGMRRSARLHTIMLQVGGRQLGQ